METETMIETEEISNSDFIKEELEKVNRQLLELSKEMKKS